MPGSDKNKSKAWHHDLPWDRRLEIEDAAERRRDNAENNREGGAKYFDFTTAYRYLKRMFTKKNNDPG